MKKRIRQEPDGADRSVGTLVLLCSAVDRRQLGEPQCHLVIDIDRLSLDDSYRREIENRLGDLVGMAISFADCRVERYDENLSWSGPQFEALERDVETLTGLRSDVRPTTPRPIRTSICAPTPTS